MTLLRYSLTESSRVPFVYYSYLIVLGSASSCLIKFTPVPFMHCTISNVCNYPSPTSSSYWLASAEPVPTKPVRDSALTNYISRCSVCLAHYSVIALHSQSTETINCPTKMRELWSGYSFLMVSSNRGNSVGFSTFDV